jgi:hypothetical protein
MNVWKPLALTAVAALGLVVSLQAAYAGGSGSASAPQAGLCHDQPNMTAALSGLRAARASLDRAEHNKGGWRSNAITATNTAIAEAERGCAFADTH